MKQGSFGSSAAARTLNLRSSAVGPGRTLLRSHSRRAVSKSKEEELGWTAYASWTKDGDKPITRFEATWTVPPPPAIASGQTLYFFNSLESTGDDPGILQPVLQWGTLPESDKQCWMIASWYVLNSGSAFTTYPSKVQSGQVLHGVIICTNWNEKGFYYDCAFAGIPKTRLLVEAVPELTIASVALEAYNVADRNGFPNTNRTIFENLSLATEEGALSAQWEAGDYVPDDAAHAEVEQEATVAVIYG